MTPLELPYLLLGRNPINTNADGTYLTGKRVLVTGAGGSIGSLLCQHITQFDPAELTMLDRDESALHALQLTMTGRAMLDDGTMVLADIRDYQRIKTIMAQRRPDIVFHAAALKHQPLLEQYPGEAWKTNVVGTHNLLCAANHADVQVVVNISTDKAADPTCVLGMSKRIAERLVAWWAPARYVSVRFGNVFGSRGSVMDTFMAQLGAGMPLTVTGPGVTRYFMTGHEAVSLVIHAGAIGRPMDVLVLDMGEPVLIEDIATRLISVFGTNTKIEYTGLRPGERTTERRIGAGEPDERPLHPLISQVTTPTLPSALLATVNPDNADTSKIKRQMLTLCTH